MPDLIINLLNYSVLIAFFATSIDSSIQILHVIKRKSSKDLSLIGCSIRLIAALIFTIKFYTTGDLFLIIGQTIFSVIYIIYFFILIYFR